MYTYGIAVELRGKSVLLLSDKARGRDKSLQETVPAGM